MNHKHIFESVFPNVYEDFTKKISSKGCCKYASSRNKDGTTYTLQINCPTQEELDKAIEEFEKISSDKPSNESTILEMYQDRYPLTHGEPYEEFLPKTHSYILGDIIDIEELDDFISDQPFSITAPKDLCKKIVSCIQTSFNEPYIRTYEKDKDRIEIEVFNLWDDESFAIEDGICWDNYSDLIE